MYSSIWVFKFRSIWYASLNIYFQFLNNITGIFTYFFTHMYFQKNLKLLFKHTYQTSPQFISFSFFYLLGCMHVFSFYFSKRMMLIPFIFMVSSLNKFIVKSTMNRRKHNFSILREYLRIFLLVDISKFYTLLSC